MTLLWLFATSLRSFYVSLTGDQILHLHFLDVCKSVGGKLTSALITWDLRLPFTLLAFVFFCPSWAHVYAVWLSTTCCQRGAPARRQRLMHARTHANTHSLSLLPLPSSGFSLVASCCQAGRQTLPPVCHRLSLPPACSVSSFLGQMTLTIIARLIKAVQ